MNEVDGGELDSMWKDFSPYYIILRSLILALIFDGV